MINEQGIAVNTPDLSRLYIISGRMMFDDEEGKVRISRSFLPKLTR